MNLIVFEDAGAEQLFPITTGRPSYTITCASFRLIDVLLENQEPNDRTIGLVRDYLLPQQAADYPRFTDSLKVAAADPSESLHPWTMVVNARVVPSVANLQHLRALRQSFATDPEGSVPRVIRQGWAVAAAVIPTATLVNKQGQELLRSIEDYCNGAIDKVQMESPSLTLYEYPHDVVRENQNNFHDNLESRRLTGDYREIQPGVFARGNQNIADYVIFDTSSGPILMEEGVSIGPFTLIEGPVYIDRHCRIIEHAAIKDCVSLGHTTKIGGEVEASVVERFTNKQHHGFLGHSYLGSWINLGAGTCNSDLKNTYGKVNMEYDGQRVPTDMRFIGCIMGDYAKTAINTSIFTGKTIGACSMVYGFVTTNVPSFVNYARSFGQTTELPPEVMQSTQKRMFDRRAVEQRPCDVQLLADMHRVTSHERQLSGEPLVL